MKPTDALDSPSLVSSASAQGRARGASAPSLEDDLCPRAPVASRETLTLFELETLQEARAQVSAGARNRAPGAGAVRALEIVRAFVPDVVRQSQRRARCRATS